MMLVTSKIEIDILNPGKIPRIAVSQGDYHSRRIAFTLLADGQAWPLPENAVFGLRYRKPDSTTGSYDTLPDGQSAWSVNDNVVSVALAPQLVSVPGCVNAQVEITDGNAILATFPFQIIVAEDPSRPVLQSASYFNWQQWVNGQLKEHIEELKESGAFTGATPNLQIGTVTSLPAGSSATATIRGTAEAPLLDLGIPAGADPVVDDTLTLPGYGADAKATGDALRGKLPGAMAALLPKNGITQDELPTGFFAYSTTPTLIPAIGLPGEFSQNGTFFGIRGTEQQVYCYVDQNGHTDTYDITNQTWHSRVCLKMGVEYETPNYWYNKKVYTKLVDLGTFPNSSRKVVAHNSAATQMLQCIGMANNGDCIPLWHEDGNITLYASLHNIHISTNSDRTYLNGWAQIWYTK